MRSASFLAVAPLALALALLASGSASSAPDQPAGDIDIRPAYVAPGVRSSATLASAVICTNFGTINAEINAAFIEFDGSFACNPGALVIAPGQTATLATAAIDALANETVCITPPTIGQGHVRIAGRLGFSLRFGCSVWVLPRSGTTPASLDRLTLYLADGGQVSDVIFRDGFQP